MIQRIATCRAVSIGLCVLTSVCLANGRAAGQETDSAAGLAISVSAVSVHAIGVGAEYRLSDRLRLLARADGLWRRLRAAGVGARVDILRERQTAVYAAGLLGQISCHSKGYENGCEGGSEHSVAIAPNAGVEFGLSRRWSAALEVTYWTPLDRSTDPPTDYSEPRFTIGATVRWLVDF